MQNKQLTESQQVVLNDLIKWYNSSQTFGILQGKAGTGKTFLVQYLINSIPNIIPLLLAETNEAVSVLVESTKNKFETKTVCSALGLSLSHEGSKQILVQQTQPNLEKFNFIVIDEASMLDETRLNILYDLGMKILFIGHSSQLPPVDTALTSHDKCISPVFLKGYPIFTLTEGIRNKGELEVFCDKAEQLISSRGILPQTYSVSKLTLSSYLNNKDNLQRIIVGDTVTLAWTNKAVEEHNKQLRSAIYDLRAKQEEFIVGDRLIFRSPTACFNFPVSSTCNSLDEILTAKTNKFTALTTNSKGVITFINETNLLGVACYELHVKTDHFDLNKSKGIVYVVIDEIAFEKLKKKLYTSALYTHDPVMAHKAWKRYHDLSYVFSNAKHAYAITVHCSQGSTIKNVFVDDKDINKCSNPYLKKKLRYVAYSRASDNLYRMN